MDYFNQKSERLLFRKLPESDISSWTDFFENNDSLPYLGMDLSLGKNELAKGWILKQLDRYESDGLGHLAVIEKSTGDFIGMGGILSRSLLDQKEFEIAYSLKPAHWGKGYGTEIARQLKNFGLQSKISKRFISIIDKENIASIKVAIKNDMTVFLETTYLGMDVFVYGYEDQLSP